MARYVVLALFLVGLTFAACGQRSNGPDIGASDSRIVIMSTGANPVTISTPDARGAITMQVGDQRMFKIMRTVTDNGTNQSTTTDVTSTADFNFSEVNVAAMDATGRLTALASGFTQLSVKFRDNDTDPTDNDEVDLDITVLP